MRAETRHSLKQDQFTRATVEAADWTVAHKSKIVAAIVILAALLLVGGGVWYYLSQQERKASFALNQALRTSQTPVRPANMPAQPGLTTFASSAERDSATRKQYQDVVDQYSHTRSGDIARYLLGVTEANQGDYAAAEGNLNKVSSVFDKDLSSLAKFALASVYAKEKKDSQAIDLYKKLMDSPSNTVTKTTVQFRLAELYTEKQQPLEAKRIYEQIQKENPATEIAAAAQSKAAEIK